MKILLVEDDIKHLKDAKKAFEEFPGVEVHFVSTLNDFQKAINAHTYDGIISDIFFPSSSGVGEGRLKGWSLDTVCGCMELLVGHGVNYGDYDSLNDFARHVVEASDAWVDGKIMHPSGVIVVNIAQQKDIPVVLCTDTYHHGYATQPVANFASKKNVPLIDSYDGGYEGSAPEKNWGKAIEELIKRIIKN